VVGTSGPCYDSRGGVLHALKEEFVQIRSRRAIQLMQGTANNRSEIQQAPLTPFYDFGAGEK